MVPAPKDALHQRFAACTITFRRGEHRKERAQPLTRTSCWVVQVFINRVQLICGQPTIVKSEAADHLWVTKHEIGEYLGDAMGVYLQHLI